MICGHHRMVWKRQSCANLVDLVVRVGLAVCLALALLMCVPKAASADDAQTMMSSVRQSTCGEDVDIAFAQFHFPAQPGFRALYECIDRSELDDAVYLSARIRIDDELIEEEGEPALNRLKTACHETGHSVGMSHYSAPPDYYLDCMISGNVSGGHIDYDDHHITHVLNRYS